MCYRAILVLHSHHEMQIACTVVVRAQSHYGFHSSSLDGSRTSMSLKRLNWRRQSQSSGARCPGVVEGSCVSEVDCRRETGTFILDSDCRACWERPFGNLQYKCRMNVPGHYSTPLLRQSLVQRLVFEVCNIEVSVSATT
jgi:hypothetical protein